MLLKILIALAVLVAGFCIYAATRPATFRYSRSLVIQAPPESLFPYINDIHKFQEWNPFMKEEADGRITFSGPEAGVGASCDWSGGKSGEGTMTVVESRPSELVRFRMEFRKPFAATHTAEFTLVPDSGGTRVGWDFFGDNNFLAKSVGVFIDCEKMCGSEFEKGLARLKELAERPPLAASRDVPPTLRSSVD